MINHNNFPCRLGSYQKTRTSGWRSEIRIMRRPMPRSGSRCHRCRWWLHWSCRSLVAFIQCSSFRSRCLWLVIMRELIKLVLIWMRALLSGYFPFLLLRTNNRWKRNILIIERQNENIIITDGRVQILNVPLLILSLFPPINCIVILLLSTTVPQR